MAKLTEDDRAKQLTILSIKPAAPKPKMRWIIKKNAVASEQSSNPDDSPKEDLHSLCNMDVFRRRY
ncbi:hypothetical protein H0O00_04945 [Candidatus Micrarchaeota archaeon]|nr:hypothetical protein [Candidatus Micrarchaeota archaeon]